MLKIVKCIKNISKQNKQTKQSKAKQTVTQCNCWWISWCPICSNSINSICTDEL